MTTPPTPAEVAEARAWFERHPNPELWIGDFGDGHNHAAVLVRAALAAPAEQPREDEIESIAVALWHLWGDVSSGAVARPGPVDDRFHELIARVRALAARSVSPSADLSDELEAARVYFAREIDAVAYPEVTQEARLHAAVVLRAFMSGALSAVPAVSAGGAGRDLTAADVRDSYVLLLEAGVPTHEERQFVAEHLNAIARPADTGTQATEQTTETTRWWRIISTHPNGDQRVVWESHRDPFSLDEVREVLEEFREGFRDQIGAPLHVEARTETTTTSVSPWSPVAVHDENGAQR